MFYKKMKRNLVKIRKIKYLNQLSFVGIVLGTITLSSDLQAGNSRMDPHTLPEELEGPNLIGPSKKPRHPKNEWEKIKPQGSLSKRDIRKNSKEGLIILKIE